MSCWLLALVVTSSVGLADDTGPDFGPAPLVVKQPPQQAPPQTTPTESSLFGVELPAGLDRSSLYNMSASLLGVVSSSQAAFDVKALVTDLIRSSSLAAPNSLPKMFQEMFARLAQGIVSHVSSPSETVKNQDQLKSYYRRMLLIWKDILQSDIGNGNPLVTAVVTEWMRALVPLQTWASISAVTVADMSRLMQDLMVWAQTDEKCVPNPSRVCNVDPIRMQFAVEFMRATMPMVLTGQIKLGLLKKFLTSFKRVSTLYPRVGFQMMGLLKANPPLMIHAILHIFSNDGPDLESIKGTSVKWGESPDLTFYELRNCVGSGYFTSLDERVVDLCTSMFSNGHGVNLSARSVKLAPYSLVKLISCPDDPNNKQEYFCAGNMQDDCEFICEQDRGQTPNCLAMCLQVKEKKMKGRTIENCNNPRTVKCVRSFYSEMCINLDEYFAISYAYGKTVAGADDFTPADERECPR